MKSRLGSVTNATGIGLLGAVGVFLIYDNALPSITDICSAQPHDDDVEKARKHAAWMGAGLAVGMFVLGRDYNSFIITGGALAVIDVAYKHANALNSATGKVDVDTSTQISSVHPLPNYDVG